MATVVRESVPTLATCLAHYLTFRRTADLVTKYERHNISFFEAARRRQMERRDKEHGEYLRQRSILERKHGDIAIDAALEKLVKHALADAQQEENDAWRRHEQNNFHGCYMCVHAHNDIPEDLDAWCQKLKAEPNLFARCPLFRRAT